MSHGLAMFDRDQRLVVCNDRFMQVYALPPELVRPGTPLQDILKYRVTSGSLRAPDHFVESRMSLVAAGEASDSVVEWRWGIDRCRTAAGSLPTRM
jgi:hypothetical protein